MRIDRLAIRHYGPLEPRILNFSPGCEGLHVVYGGNEWGKSLALQALEHGLFSVPKRIDGFSDQAMLQLEIELSVRRRGEGAATVAFRRRRQSLTVADSNQPLDEERLRGFLGGISAETFRQMYGLSAERIRDGGRLLLEVKGDIEATLFAAATGLEQIRAVSKSLDERLGKLFSPTGKASNPHLNSAIRSLGERLAILSTLTHRPDATDQLQRQLHDVRGEFAVIEAELRGLSERSSRLSRVRAARTAASQLQAVRRQLAESVAPPLLADTFRTRLDQARAAIHAKAPIHEKLRATLAERNDQRKAITVDDRIIAAAELIDSLLGSANSLIEIDTDLPRRRADIERLTTANQSLFRAIVATTGQPLRENAWHCSDTLTEIGRLIESHGSIVTACDERQRQLEAGRGQLESLEADLARLPLVGDVRGLKDELTAILDAGDLEHHLADKQEQRAQAEADYAAACRRLDGRQGGFPPEELPVPTLEEVREHRERLRGFEQDRSALDREKTQTEAEITSLESRISLLEHEADLPAEGELERVRRDRDAAIDATAADVAAGRVVAPEAAARFAEITDLVHQADALADRLLRYADQASQRRQHRVSIDGHQAMLGRLEDRRHQLAEREAEATRRWQALWQPAGVVPKSPTAMEAWLSIHGECRQRADGLRKIRLEIDQIERRIAADRDRLMDLLARLGGSLPATDTSRRDLLFAATAAIDERQTAAVTREQRVDQIETTRRDMSRLEANLAAATAARDGWNRHWADCLALLDQPASVATTTGRFLLDTMRTIADNEEAIASQRERMTKMEDRQAVIHDRMREVCGLLGRPFDPRAIQDVCRAARERLQAAQTALERRQSLDDDIARLHQDIERVGEERADAEAVLATLRREAEVETDDELDAAWDRSQRFRDLRRQAEECERAFLGEAGSADAEALLADCLAATSEERDAEMVDLQRQTAELNARRDKVRDRQRTLESQVEALGNDRAAKAASDCRESEAEVMTRVSQYLPLRLASLALGRASRRYRDEHHAPVLNRASHLFKRITGGRYTEIQIAENRLLAVRADATTESVQQRHMSEGTRDQIYLALRLAALEDTHEQGAEPLPLILDDGLVHFDDERTAAMLDVLADVSARMQVILFTHHRSVHEIAVRLRAARPETVFVQGEAAEEGGPAELVATGR